MSIFSDFGLKVKAFFSGMAFSLPALVLLVVLMTQEVPGWLVTILLVVHLLGTTILAGMLKIGKRNGSVQLWEKAFSLAVLFLLIVAITVFFSSKSVIPLSVGLVLGANVLGALAVSPALWAPLRRS